MNKRGMDTSTLLILITGVIILIVIVPITLDIIDIGNETANMEACKAAVRFAAYKPGLTENIAVQALGSPEKVAEACPYKILIPDEDTETTTVINELSKEILNCWDKFGRGEVNFITPAIQSKKFSLSNLCYDCVRIMPLKQNSKLTRINVDDVIKEVKDEAKLRKIVNPHIIFNREFDSFDLSFFIDVRYITGSSTGEIEDDITSTKKVHNLDKNPLIDTDFNSIIYVTFIPQSAQNYRTDVTNEKSPTYGGDAIKYCTSVFDSESIYALQGVDVKGIETKLN